MSAIRLHFAALFATLLALTLPSAASAQGNPDTPLRAMSFNIRLDLESDGANSWAHRRDMATAVIGREAPDVLGMQEVLLGQKRDLEAALPQYQSVGVARDDGGEGGEYSPIFFNRDRFALIDSGTIWLSPTPSVPGKGWDAAYPRIATWALLRDRRSNILLRVANTHFDHVGKVAQFQSAWLIAHWLANGEWSRYPTILTGDFNVTPDRAPFKLIDDQSVSGLRDARSASRTPPYGPPGTYNAFKIEANEPSPIDHIFVSNGIRVDRYAVVTDHWGGRLPSDHYPVLVDLSVARP